MSLFAYTFRLAGGKLKEGRVTAKTEAAARQRLAKEHQISEWISIKETPTSTAAGNPPSSSSAPPTPAAAKPASQKSGSGTKLGRMLYLQHGRCFFCGLELPEAEASIEHLHPTSKGGSRTEDNEVACCKALNQTFGDMDLKRKFEFVLKAAGNFRCPRP